MQFDVKSGKHFKTVNAQDFDHAASVFLKKLLSEEEDVKLSDVIHVTCKTIESYIHTDVALSGVDSVNCMKIYYGE